MGSGNWQETVVMAWYFAYKVGNIIYTILVLIPLLNACLLVYNYKRQNCLCCILHLKQQQKKNKYTIVKVCFYFTRQLMVSLSDVSIVSVDQRE